jgi:peptide deformylase
VSLEGCLSLRSPDGRLRSFQVERFENIRLIGYRLVTDQSLNFVEVDYALTCFQEGIVFQHEADHNFGQDKLISKIGKEMFVW